MTWFAWYARSVVDVQLLYVAGLLGVDVDLLERNQLGRQRQGPPEIFLADLDDAHRNIAGAQSQPRVAGSLA